MVEKDSKNLTTIGSSVLVTIGEGIKNVPARVDTGASSSSIWASNIHVGKDKILRFCLFDKASKYYDGRIHEYKDYKTVITRSSMGQTQTRYKVILPVVINGRKIRALFSLADRSRNRYPILIGRRTLRGKFIVSVAQDVNIDNVKEQI